MARKPKNPTDMSALFNTTSGTLAQIAAKTNSFTILSDIVRQTCPDLPEDVWKIANFRGTSLIIEVNSAVWSQRLQFERMNICRELATQTNNEFSQLEIKVTPHRSRIPQKPISTSDQSSSSISSATAQQLLDVASNAPEGLKQKLKKLAAHAKK